MRKLLILLLIIPFATQAQEQADTLKLWETGGIASFNFSQVSLTNWAAGGKSSLSGTVLGNIHANYEKDKISWENSLDIGYGILKEGDAKYIKTDDKIDFNSKFGLRPKEKFLYSVLFNFRSQFTDGYKYPDRENAISRFMAPGYFTLALGLDYSPHDNFSFFVSPLTGKLTIVTDKTLSDLGAFGVNPGEKSRSEMGAFVKTEANVELIENVSLETKLDLFSNYLDSPENIDIHWDVMINMKINDYLSTNIITNLIYDNNVKLQIDSDGDGITDKEGPRTQFKELIGIGLNLNF